MLTPRIFWSWRKCDTVKASMSWSEKLRQCHDQTHKRIQSVQRLMQPMSRRCYRWLLWRNTTCTNTNLLTYLLITIDKSIALQSELFWFQQNQKSNGQIKNLQKETSQHIYSLCNINKDSKHWWKRVRGKRRIYTRAVNHKDKLVKGFQRNSKIKQNK